MKVHKILIPLIIALTFVLIQGCAVDDRALDGSKEKSPQLAVNDEVITPDPEDEIIDFKIRRSYDELILKIKPNLVLGEDNLGNKLKKRMVGIKLSAYNDKINHVKLGPAQALVQSFNEVYFVTVSSLKYPGSMIVGKGDTSQLGGPIRIAKISGQVAEFGIIPFISMMAYISISLGLINLFPIPMLDGGHLMFYGFEKILGRPLSQKTQEGFFRIGMFLLLSLMFFVTFNDLRDLGLF